MVRNLPFVNIFWFFALNDNDQKCPKNYISKQISFLFCGIGVGGGCSPQKYMTLIKEGLFSLYLVVGCK